MSAPALKKCPACGKNLLSRKIGLGAGVIFKGGGFYETDYRSESYKQGAKAESPATADAGHVHSGTCGCGKKPADQCGAGAAAAPAVTTGKAKSKGKSEASSPARSAP